MEPIWSPSSFHVARKPQIEQGETMSKVSKPCLSSEVRKGKKTNGYSMVLRSLGVGFRK